MNIKDLFSNISGTYDLLNKVLSFGTDKRWRQKGTTLLPHGKKTRILDMASGTLEMALEYLKQGDGEVTALDFSESMLQTGWMKVSPTLDDRLHLVCGDSLNLPFPDAHFDGVMCAWGVRNFENVQANLSETFRILKPGAPFVVIDFFKPTTTLSRLFSKTYGKYVIPSLGRFISKNDLAYEYLHQSIQGFYTLNEYTWMMTQTGFAVQRKEDLSGGISSLILAIKDE